MNLNIYPPRTYPYPCDLCGQQVASPDERLDGHGIGNCVPVCDTCAGAGEDEASTLCPACKGTGSPEVAPEAQP